MSLTAHADDVYCHEIAFILSKAVTQFAAQPGNRVPSASEVQAHQARQALLNEHPAVRLAVKQGEQAWLGAAAIEAGVLTKLAALGWTDAGDVPEGVKRPCDYATDPDAFKTAFLTPEA